MRNFPHLSLVLGFLLITSINIHSGNSIKQEALFINGFISFGVSFAPAALQPLLLLGVQTLLFDDMFSDTSTEKTEKIINHITDSTERLEKLIVIQHQKSYDQLENYFDKTRIVESAMKKMSNIKNFFKRGFRTCVFQKKCTEHIRNANIDELLDSGSARRSEYTELIENMIIRENSDDSDKRFFDVILQISDYNIRHNEDCNNTQSVQNVIYNYHVYITDMTVMMFMMVLYAHYAYFSESGNPGDQQRLLDSMQVALDEFKKHAHSINSASRSALAKASRDIRPCDPLRHEKSRTWERLHNFIQAFVIDGYYLKGDYERRTCSIRRETRLDQNLIEEQGIPQHLSTQERLLNCSKFEFDSIHVDLKDSERIYHHLITRSQVVNFEIYGKTTGASEWDQSRLLSPSTVTHFAGLAATPISQDYPICLCQIDQANHKNTLRRFNTGAVLTNPGMVVTGVRWVKGDNRMFLEIQEGRLVNGSVDLSSVKWLKNSPDPSLDDVMNVDYRSVSLDDVILPVGSFVTGVQLCRTFLPRSDEKADTLTLCLWGSTMNKFGNLNLDQTAYTVNTTTKREEIILDNLDCPDNDRRNTVNKVIREQGKRFVKFQPASLKTDAGQTTIPYLDIQEIVTIPSAPISGIGMYYKGSKNFGGFIGLKLISADVISLIDDERSDGIFEKLTAGALEEMQNFQDKKINVGKVRLSSKLNSE